MSNIGNKQVFAKNLERYMKATGKSRTDICQALGIKYSTFSEWANGRKYPRITAIEMLANYFGILKSDLIEDKGEDHIEMQKKAGTITDAVLRMKTDPEFLSLVEDLMKLESEKIKGVKQLVDLMQ